MPGVIYGAMKLLEQLATVAQRLRLAKEEENGSGIEFTMSPSFSVVGREKSSIKDPWNLFRGSCECRKQYLQEQKRWSPPYQHTKASRFQTIQSTIHGL